jgi:hypothetical protein
MEPITIQVRANAQGERVQARKGGTGTGRVWLVSK